MTTLRIRRPAAANPLLAAAGPVLVAATLAAGCGERESASESGSLSTTVDTVGGVVRVANVGAPEAWRLAPVVSIGPESVAERETPDEFGRVSSVAFGPDGTVFVADMLNREIRVFGLDGSHLRTIGRDGEGPGEFRSAYSIAWVGDRLLAYDPHLGRIGELSSHGEWLGQRATAGGMTGSPATMRFYPVGEWDNGTIGFYGHAMGAKLLQHPAAGGALHSAWGYDYRIALTQPGGDTLRVVERTLPTEPISDDEWAAGSAEYDEAMELMPNGSCNPRGFRRPDRKPFIDEMFVAPDGRLWVQVIRSAGNRWEIFDSEGRLLGSVPAAPYKEGTVPAFSGDYLATIRQDELDLDHVDVWRLERG